mmetsp:Transcript_15754/g.29392  ORF Transcript_15754/g.29392 Transcript_15754/m.29392 type:complete len:217 (-) Transcript_15754:18-668(-)
MHVNGLGMWQGKSIMWRMHERDFTVQSCTYNSQSTVLDHACQLCPRETKNFSDSTYVLLDIFTEMHIVILVISIHKISVIDSHAIWKLLVGLQIPRFLRRVLNDDVALLILKVTQRNKHNVSLIHPDFLAHLATDVTEPLCAVAAHHLTTAVAQHPQHLAVLLAILLEDELALCVVCAALCTFGLVTSEFVLWHLSLAEEYKKQQSHWKMELQSSC